MSFLATLFSQSRFEKKPHISGLRRGSQECFKDVVDRNNSRAVSKQSNKSLYVDSLSACETLEPRIALSVNTIISENLVEENYSGDAQQTHPGQVIIASDLGSDVFIQQLQTDPTELLIANNGSFQDYLAIEDVENNYEEVFVTNGTLQQLGTSEKIVADSWWLFPSNEDATEFNQTRLALDRTHVVVGDFDGGRDLFGSIKYLQADGTLSEWKFSSWSGLGTDNDNFVQPPGDNTVGDPLYVTGGPGFGGRSESLQNRVDTEVEGLPTGYLFPRSIRLEAVGNNFTRRMYLTCEWSQTPIQPPIMEVNYRGESLDQITGTPNFRFISQRDYEDGDGPVVGLAARSNALRFRLKDAIVSGSDDGSRTLGIVPGTLSGRIEVGTEDQDLVYETNFRDRRNVDAPQQSWELDIGGDEYSLYFQNIDDADVDNNEDFYRFGRLYREIGPNAYQDVDHAYERGVQISDNGSDEPLGIAGGVVDQSTIEFRLASYRTTDLGYDNLQTSLDGFNVSLTEIDLEVEEERISATTRNREAVRLKDLRYLVFVKPTIPNDVVFAPGATITRNVTVDLLSEDSSIYVNSPIDVANPDGDIDFRATNVYINAPTETSDYFFIGRSESIENARLPRTSSPQGGTRISPTFGQVISNEVQTQTVTANAVVGNDLGGITELVVLPGNEGLGYDPQNPPTIKYEPTANTTAKVEILTVVGGVSDLILGDTGFGYPNSSDDVNVTFSAPQLRRVDRFESWSDSPLAEGYTASPIVAISQPEVVASQNRIGSGDRARSVAYVGDGIVISKKSGGSNYSVPPTVKLELTPDAEARGIPLYDPDLSGNPDTAPLLTIPVLTAEVDVFVEFTPAAVPGAGDTIKYVSGSVTELKVSSPGFGLNYDGIDDKVNGGNGDGVIDLFDIRNRFQISVTGGTSNNNVGINWIDKTDPDNIQTGKTTNKQTLNNFPTAGKVNHAVMEITAPLFGTLTWQDGTSGPLSLANQGENYELSPAVQFVTKLAAEVPTTISANPAPAVEPVVVVEAGDKPGTDPATHKVSLQYVTAFEDDRTDVTASQYVKGPFRDIDYLSYMNEPRFRGVGFTGDVERVAPGAGDTFDNYLQMPNSFNDFGDLLFGQRVVDDNSNFLGAITGIDTVNRRIVLTKDSFISSSTVDGLTFEPLQQVVAKVSADGETFYSATVGWFEGVDGSLNSLDELTGQIGVKAYVDPVTGEILYGDADFEDFIGTVTNVHIYFDESFIDLELDGVPDIFPIMGRDPARGRAVSSNGEITSVEVTYPGSGYIATPTVTVSSGTEDPATSPANATAVVTGGVYEMVITNAGFNYTFDEIPGSVGDVLVGNVLELFENPEPGEVNPIIDFGVRNTALQGGAIRDPGDGIQIVETGITNINPTLNVEAETNEAKITEPAYVAVIDELGVLQGFEVQFGVTSVTIDIENGSPEAGFGYAADAEIPLIFSAPTGENSEIAEGVAKSDSEGKIIEVELTNPGFGYDKNEDVTVTIDAVPGGTAAKLSAVVGERFGLGYSSAPRVIVDPPSPIANATAQASVDASLGVVSHIEVVDSGNRYAVPPRVVVRPPNPRGEGVAATAIAVLNNSGGIERIDVVDGGGGYSAPPEVMVQPHFEFAKSEFLDVASSVNAGFYEIYTTHSDWTDRERGQVLVRPQAALGDNAPGANGFSNRLFIEASSADLIFEGDLKSKQIMSLMQSTEEKQMVAPFTVTTQSRATQQQSGTIFADTLAFTLGNNIPTPRVGSSITNTFDVRTDVDNIRVTAAESVVDPRGAFPYALSVTETNDLIVDAVPRSGSTLSFDVANKLTVSSAIHTDSDVLIKAANFAQTSPVITESGQISVEANSINILNSLQVVSAPVDDRRVDISLTATNGAVNLEGLIEAPNAIEIFQTGGQNTIGGPSRLTANHLRMSAIGDIDVTTDVHSVVASSENGGLKISEANDVSFERLTARNGTIQLEAFGVDKGRQGENPIALTARILESDAIIVSAPNGSIDVIVDSSDDIELGLSNPGNNTAVMEAAGSVRITSAAGSVDVFDGPVAGGSARQVRVATTEPLAVRHTYQGNTPGAFPSTLSGEGALPVIDGVSLDIGDLVLVKNQADKTVTTRIDESRENGIYVVSRLGGNVGGYRDWLLTRPNDADTRAEFLPGTFVSVGEGETLANSIFQTSYPTLPAIQVMRTDNSQLVVAGGTGGLLNLDLNDNVTGEGIIPGARVTGVDFVNGVISLGVGNAINVQAADVNEGSTETVVKIRPSELDTELLRSAIDSALDRGEQVLVSGPGFKVGAQIETANFNEVDSTYDLHILNTDIDDDAAITYATIGFAAAASGRTVLNPAVRSFLVSSAVETTDNTITLSPAFTAFGSLREGQSVFGDGVAPDTVITKILPGIRQVEVSPNGLPREITFESDTTVRTGNVPAPGDPNPDEITNVDTTNISLGWRVIGSNIPDGATIESIDLLNNQLTLSAPVTEGTGTTGEALTFSPDFVELKDSSSPYFGEGFDEYLQMPDSFNDFYNISLGQKVVAAGLNPGAVITGIDTVYRQIGLKSGSVSTAQTIGEINFKSIETVNFGMVNKLGSGTVLFSADTFGYAGTQFQTPRIASGLASINEGATYSNKVSVDSIYAPLNGLSLTSESAKGLAVSGVGLNDGYRLHSFDGKDLTLFSATTETVISDNDVIDGKYQSKIKVDDGFDSFMFLNEGMSVSGPAVSPITANVKISAIDESTGTLTLESDVELEVSALQSEYFVFGEVLKPKFKSSAATKSAFSIHAADPSLNTFIGSQNLRQVTRYEVSSDSGSAAPGSLYSLIDIAQNNQFTTLVDGNESNSVITFSPQVQNIRLENPLPEITRRALTLDGKRSLEVGERSVVSIDGRFITEDALGNAILANTVVDGLVIKGEDASGSIVRGVRLGGFDNAAAIRVEGTSDVLLSDVDLGLTRDGTRAGARYGLYVTGESANTTFIDSSVVGATSAAIRIDGDSRGTTIIGSNLGSSEIINKVGVEVASSETNIGVLPIEPRVTSGTETFEPKIYEASYTSGRYDIQLESVSSTEWDKFIPGLAVVGDGLESGTTVVSVDEVNKRLIIDKSIVSSVLSDGQVLVGHGATGPATSRTLSLNDSVPLDSLFLGQTVRVVGGLSEGSIDTAKIATIDVSNRTIRLDRALTSAGFYSDSTRLVEFVASRANVIESNTTGVVVGLFSNANGFSGSENLVLDQSFDGWQSLAPVATANADAVSAQSLIVLDDTTNVREGLLVAGTGVPEGTTVVSKNSDSTITLSEEVSLAQDTALEFRPVVKVFGPGITVDTSIYEINVEDRTVKLSKPLEADINSSPVRFEGANRLAVVNTTIRNNVGDGVVVGGGENHSFGQVKELIAYPSKELAEAAKQGNEQVLELVSWNATSTITVGGDLNLSDSRVYGAVLDIATITTDTVTTEQGATTLEVADNVASELNQYINQAQNDGDVLWIDRVKVDGPGIDFNTKVESVDVEANVVTLSKATTQGFQEAVDIRFIDEFHPDFASVRIYGSEGLANDCKVNSFDLDNQAINVSKADGQEELELEDAELYFGLNKFVVADPALIAGLHVEGELLIEADATGAKEGIELTLGNGFSEWSQLSYGLSVTGTSIPAETIVTSWNENAGTLTLSNPLTDVLTNESVRFESRVPEYTVVEAVRAPFTNDEGEPILGYLAINTPPEEEPSPLLVGQAALSEIRLIRRDRSSNSISANGGFGMTVASVESSDQAYGDIVATWAVAGNYFDLDLNRSTGSLSLSRNLEGAISSEIFAKLPIDAGRDLYFSTFSKTDRYGNQYGNATPVQSGDGGGFVDEPDDPINPPTNEPIDEGEAPEPEDGIWPGSPF